METIETTKIRLEAFILETAADADVSPGSVLGELVLKLSSSIHNELINKGIDDLSQARTVQDALDSATETYSDNVDAIASNYNTYRNQGSKVTGSIKVEVSASRTYFLEKNFTFVQPNLKFNYVTSQAYEVTPNTPTTANQLKLNNVNGKFYFIVPVLAEEVGAEEVAGNKNNTQVTNRTRFDIGGTSKLTGFVGAEAYGNFTSGSNRETDREVITRFKEGLSYKGLSSPKAMTSVFKDTFPEFKALSVVGSNDAEVGRAKSNLFGISTLGMADVYVRTSTGIETKTVDIIGTKKDSTTWTFTIGSGIVPGFYRIISIAPKTSTSFDGTYLVTSQVYDYEYSTDSNNNFISSTADARYTKYQTCAVEFAYVSANPSSTSETFTVTLSYMPIVKDIQDYILSDDNRIVSADYLVKAVVPCNISLGLNLYRKSINDTLPIADIKRDIFDYINSIPFGEDLVVSNIVDICHNYNIKRVDGLSVKIQSQ